MDKEQTIETGKPFDMAEFAAELTDDTTMADAYRAHVRATRLIRDLITERVRQGITQRELAKRMGVSASTVCRFEDKQDVDLELGLLVQYANALGLHPAIVFNDAGQSDAASIKSCVFAIHGYLKRLTALARKHPDDAELCDGIAKFQAEVLINFLDKYRDSADLPRVFDFIPQPEKQGEAARPTNQREMQPA
jgi:transcriptional regulator with XRE-family HTH domain